MASNNLGIAAPQPVFAAVAEASDTAALDQERDEQERDDVLVLGSRGKVIRTIGEAVEHLNELMEAQVTKAVDLGAAANTSCPGDAGARSTFYTLLPDRHQRLVFLRLVGQSRAWPRLRPLFGAPPYGFLRPEDAGLLRATGIAPGRSNMTHDAVQAAASYTQFGAGQLTDELAREYRVIRRQNVHEADPLPCDFSVRDKPDVLLQVRIRRRNRDVRVELLRDDQQRQQLMFPRVGERVTLKETKRMLRLQGLKPAQATATILQIKRAVPRSQNASTAALIAVVV
ncbi:MAG: hypothetical protein ACKVI4_16500 [Actinomycetales bacterium]